MPEDDKQELLRLLEAHGQQFLHSFDLPAVASKRKPQNPEAVRQKKKRKLDVQAEVVVTAVDSEEEWAGFSDSDTDEGEGNSSIDEAGL